MLLELDLANDSQPIPAQESVVATCACGSGIPVQTIRVGGRAVTLVGLPLIFQQFAEAGKAPDSPNISELMETLKIYNAIPMEEEEVYRSSIDKAYKDFWFKVRNQ